MNRSHLILLLIGFVGDARQVKAASPCGLVPATKLWTARASN